MDVVSSSENTPLLLQKKQILLPARLLAVIEVQQTFEGVSVLKLFTLPSVALLFLVLKRKVQTQKPLKLNSRELQQYHCPQLDQKGLL